MTQIMEDLKDILERLNHLERMQSSVMEFADKLKKDQDEFLVKHLDFGKSDKNVHMFEIVKRALTKVEND